MANNKYSKLGKIVNDLYYSTPWAYILREAIPSNVRWSMGQVVNPQPITTRNINLRERKAAREMINNSLDRQQYTGEMLQPTIDTIKNVEAYEGVYNPVYGKIQPRDMVAHTLTELGNTGVDLNDMFTNKYDYDYNLYNKKPLETILRSVLNPVASVQSSLGRFYYTKDKDGNYKTKNEYYNFQPIKDTKNADTWAAKWYQDLHKFMESRNLNTPVDINFGK